jgi:hypothetical protein
MSKFVLFAYNGESMCFVHVLLNALDMHDRGHEVKVVVEGTAAKALLEVSAEGHAFHKLYARVRDEGLFDGACKACTSKLGVLEGVRELGFELLDDMKGHPGMARFLEAGYTVITF